MAASPGSSGGCSWPDLQPELLGVVLSRLPSHADRVRVAAVCRPWRSNARLLCPLPPLLPWIALCDGTFLSLPDGAVHHLPVGDDVSSRVSTGSTLFLVHGDDHSRCSLMNPSPVTTTPVPEAAGWFRGKPTVRKVVVSDHLIAALVETKMFNASTTTMKIIMSTRGKPWDITRCSTMEWAEPEGGGFVSDIAIFKGKLHVLLTTKAEKYSQDELRVLDDGHEQTTIRGTLVVGPELWYDPYATSYVQRNYLVVSGDQLLMVERRIHTPLTLPRDPGTWKRTGHLKVFQATDLSSGGRGHWTQVDTLMGRAFFVSEGCSVSLPAGAGGPSSGTGVREDCIYFLSEKRRFNRPDGFGLIKLRPGASCYLLLKKDETNCENPFLDSGVYNMRDQTVKPLLSETVAAHAAGQGPWSPTWLFPETS